MPEQLLPEDRRSIDSIIDFLADANQKVVIAGKHTVGDLLTDLDHIEDMRWSDGIDATGDDA